MLAAWPRTASCFCIAVVVLVLLVLLVLLLVLLLLLLMVVLIMAFAVMVVVVVERLGRGLCAGSVVAVVMKVLPVLLTRVVPILG